MYSVNDGDRTPRCPGPVHRRADRPAHSRTRGTRSPMTAAQQPGTDGTGADLREVGTEVAREVLAPAPWAPERSGSGDEGLRITAVRTFLTGPQGCPYVVVRVETNQPGLYGLGDGSDPQRPLATRTVIDEYLGPMLVGRDPSDIEDLHRL